MDKVNESILSETILEDMKENRIDHMTYLEGMEVLDSDVEKTVVEAMNAYDYDSYTAADVRRAIYKDNRTPEDFAALLSPAALPFLEEIAQMAQKETRKHFGNSIMMFTPLYIANYCENYCIYCGFNCHNKINRAQLNEEEIEKEMNAMEEQGIICGYPTLINWDKTGCEHVTALIEVTVAPERGRGFDKVAARINQFDEVESLYLMSGSGFDLTVIIVGKTMKEVAWFVATKLAPMESVMSTATHFVLKKYKDGGVILPDGMKDDRAVITL